MKRLYVVAMCLVAFCSAPAQKQHEFGSFEFEDALKAKAYDSTYFDNCGRYTGKQIPVEGTSFAKAKFGQLFPFLSDCTITVDSIVSEGTGHLVWLVASSGLWIGPLYNSPKQYEKGERVQMYAMKWADGYLLPMIAPYWPIETTPEPKKQKKKHV